MMGLANMLIGVTDFEELLELSKKGDNGRVDTLMKDLAPDGSSLYGMKGEIISSSFSKAASGVAIKRSKSMFESSGKVTINENSDFR